MTHQLNIQILFFMLLFLASCANSVEEVSQDGKNSPVIVTSSNIAVDENQLDVVVVLVSDLDGTAKVSVKISGGADSSLFVLSGKTLRFIETPDFENPRNSSTTDANTYEVEITVNDGSGLESKKLLSVSVLNLNDNAPILTSPSYYKIPENIMEAGAIVITDADNDIVQVNFDTAKTCAPNNDNLLLTIDSGTLVFFSRPDYENVQAGGTNKILYSIQLILDDGQYEVCEEVRIEITDVLLSKPILSTKYDVKEVTFVWDRDYEVTNYTLVKLVAGGITPVETIAQLSPVELEYSIKIPSVHFENWMNIGYKLVACQNNTCLESEIVNGLDLQSKLIGYFKAPNSEAGDRFGSSVAVSGDGKTLAVGALYENSATKGINGDYNSDCTAIPTINCAKDAGGVFIYSNKSVGQNWNDITYLKASNSQADDYFGFSLDLSSDGNTLVVGAPFEDSGATGLSNNNSDKEIDDCEALTPINCVLDSGAVYIFVKGTTGIWKQKSYVKPTKNVARDNKFGMAVALSGDGNTLAVSSVNDLIGSVTIFRKNIFMSTWKQLAVLLPNPNSFIPLFGYSIALSANGDILAVASPGENGAYIFRFTENVDGSLNIQNRDFVSKPNEISFGSSIALDGIGDRFAVGSPGDASQLGEVFVYDYNLASLTWNEQPPILPNNLDIGDKFGVAVSLNYDGTYLLVGADSEDSNGLSAIDNTISGSGAAYLYIRNTDTTWTQINYLKAPNPGETDSFGYSVSMDNLAGTLAIGAHWESSSATGVSAGGINQLDDSMPVAGAVYLF